MDENSGSKLTGIRQIVKLKEFLQRWQSVTIGAKPNTPTPPPPPPESSGGGDGDVSPEICSNRGGISPDISNRLKGKVYCESDEESCCQSPGSPPDVPKGYLAVYVGPELRRFIIPTSYLSHSLFKVLLEKVEEEFGFDHSGGLTIPCEIETFKFLLNYMEHHPTDDHHHTSAEEFLNH